MFARLKGQSVNFAAIGILIIALVAAYALRHHSHIQPIWRGLLLACMAISFFAGLFNYWRLLKLSEAPISSIAAAAQGYIELQGTASTAKPMKTPYHGIPCVWYRAWVYANIPSNGKSTGVYENRLLDYSESQSVFTLNDGSGECSVDPKGAEIMHFKASTWRKNNHRYAEEYLPAGKPLYVLGQLDTRHDVLDKSIANKQVSQKLAQLKARPQHLLNRYDHNLDGEISLDEWELARQDAIKEVHGEHAMRRNLGDFTLTKPTDNHLFLISAQSPQQLRDDYKKWLAGHLGILGLLSFILVKLA